MPPKVELDGIPRSVAEIFQSPQLSRGDLIFLSKERPQLPSGVRPVDIIAKTRDGVSLTREEMFDWINGITSGAIPEYQAAAWLMAVRIKGLTPDETTDLTLAMAASGEVLDLDEFGIVTDKHSSGGVGDKTTLVVAPILAACGLTVGKMSGKGLGHTGGTLDKLESIPGLRIDLSREEFLAQMRETGIVVTGQTGELAPADKKLYALRDVTATIDSIPLIAASIMSKKTASGANHLVLDVKVGKGAFMQNLEDATSLAKTMVEIGKRVGIKVEAEITDMNQPLGEAVGNALEVLEAINTLKGDGPADFSELCLETSARMLVLAGITANMDLAREMVRKVIRDGTALEKFRTMVRAQGGDERVIDRPEEILEIAPKHPVYYHGPGGYVQSVDPMAVGLTAMHLGGGRKKKEDTIDHSVGIVMKAKIGRWLNDGDLIGFVHTSDEGMVVSAVREIESAVTVDSDNIEPLPLVYTVIS